MCVGIKGEGQTSNIPKSEPFSLTLLLALTLFYFWISAFWFTTRLKRIPITSVPFAPFISKDRSVLFPGGLYTLIKVTFVLHFYSPSYKHKPFFLLCLSWIHFSFLSVRFILMRTTTPLLADMWEEETLQLRVISPILHVSCVSWRKIIYFLSFLGFWSICFPFIRLFKPFVLRERWIYASPALP